MPLMSGVICLKELNMKSLWILMTQRFFVKFLKISKQTRLLLASKAN